MLKDSLIVTGRPSSGLRSPRANAASASRAATSARSKSRTQIALILPSCRSMRSIASCVSSTAETFFALNAADSSTALLKLHSDLATALLPLWLLEDDAQFGRTRQRLFDGDCYVSGTVWLLRRPDHDPDRQHDGAAEHDLEHGLEERRVHVARADEGDRPQFEEHHNAGDSVAIQNALAQLSGTR